MFALIAAMAAAAQTPAPEADYRADMDCLLAMTIVLGAYEDKTESKENEEGLIGLVMYYVGKIEAKAPGVDYVTEITKIMGDPDYMEKRFANDAERCGEEAAGKGAKLEQMGNALATFGEALDSSKQDSPKKPKK